jgi:hypothetical protein
MAQHPRSCRLRLSLVVPSGRARTKPLTDAKLVANTLGGFEHISTVPSAHHLHVAFAVTRTSIAKLHHRGHDGVEPQGHGFAQQASASTRPQ